MWRIRGIHRSLSPQNNTGCRYFGRYREHQDYETLFASVGYDARRSLSGSESCRSGFITFIFRRPLDASMIFETVATGGCRSYVVGCEATCAAVLIDPELGQIDRYIALTAREGLRIRYL